MAGSAKADTNYSSLVTEAVLLAGQEYKYIDIPIKRADISEPVDFEVRVSDAKCNDTQANITIYPADASDGIALMNDDISMYAASEQPTEVLQGKVIIIRLMLIPANFTSGTIPRGGVFLN